MSNSNHGNSSLTGCTTQAKLYDQGFAYNEPEMTYNQANIAYGGVFNASQDSAPIMLSGFDFYTAGSRLNPPPSNSGMLIGMLGLTYV